MSGWMTGVKSQGKGLLKTLSPGTYEWLRRRRRGPSTAAEPAPLPPWGSTATVDGITMRIDERMSEFNVRKLLVGRHTRHERDLLAGVLKADDIVMELGGGIGMVAISCAKVVGSDRVYSFEANPGLESLIRDNYALNGVSPTLAMCMLGPDEGHRTFHVTERFSRSSIFDTDRRGTPIEVPVKSFNAEIGRIRPTVLVVDIQGAEVELFEYAEIGTVETLLVEIHIDLLGDDGVEALRGRLGGMGFDEIGRAGQSFLYVRRPGSRG